MKDQILKNASKKTCASLPVCTLPIKIKKLVSDIKEGEVVSDYMKPHEIEIIKNDYFINGMKVVWMETFKPLTAH